jgi:hypothetical protein
VTYSIAPAEDPRWRRLRELLDSKLREAIARGITDERDIAEWVGGELWDELDAPESRRLMMQHVIRPLLARDIAAEGEEAALAKLNERLKQENAARAEKRKRG